MMPSHELCETLFVMLAHFARKTRQEHSQVSAHAVED